MAAQFEYGFTTACGSTANVALSPNNGAIAQAVSADITGITPNTPYHHPSPPLTAQSQPTERRPAYRRTDADIGNKRQA